MEPIQAAAPEPALTAETAPSPVMDSVEPAGAVLQPELDLDLNNEGSGQMKDKEEEEEEVEVRREVEEYATPEPVKDGNVCEQDEGMSTQQVQNHITSMSLKTSYFTSLSTTRKYFYVEMSSITHR